MAEVFDITKFTGSAGPIGQYQEQLKRLHDMGNSTECIESAVQDALHNLKGQSQKSFVIYGEPQSGKTEMMICLFAPL